jgi:hypothetical protein
VTVFAAEHGSLLNCVHFGVRSFVADVRRPAALIVADMAQLRGAPLVLRCSHLDPRNTVPKLDGV